MSALDTEPMRCCPGLSGDPSLSVRLKHGAKSPAEERSGWWPFAPLR